MIQARISLLQRSSFEEVAALAEAQGEDAMIEGKRCALTTYVQKLRSGELLATVQVAGSMLLGLGSWYTERGIIFSATGPVEATSEELTCSDVQ
jgi:hypothetical protein